MNITFIIKQLTLKCSMKIELIIDCVYITLVLLIMMNKVSSIYLYKT